MRTIAIFFCSFLLVFGLTGTAAAYPINSAADAALAGSTVIDFEDQILGTYASITIGNVSFTAVNNHLNIDNVYQMYNQSGIYLDNGTYSNEGFGVLRMDFASATNAFGFTWGMAEPFATWVLTAYDAGNNILESRNLPSTGASSAGEFFGLAANNISYATLAWNGSYDWVAIDNFTFTETAAAVPEPATMLLFGAGMIGLVTTSRKKCKK
ncbi:MAG: PEP-CTERM sorting domain-containing protein [Thermodesulfobacteriota bacterium]